MKTQSDTPAPPALLARPLVLLPRGPALYLLQRALNVVFAEPLRAGDIDFLDGRVANVRIHDAGIEFALTVADGKLVAQRAAAEPDLRIGGKLWVFLLLATRAEDSDTLFFRRELSTTGDTDLGLCIKNFLDGLELEKLPLHFAVEPLLRLGSRALRYRG